MTAPSIAVRGTIAALDAEARAVLFDRTSAGDPMVRERTRRIIERVRAEGDAALRQLASEFDGATLETLEVPRAAWRQALRALAPDLRRSLERAAENIRQVHDAFRPVASETVTADGAVIGRRPDPLARVGVYAPGGRAAYPSSLLMGVVPARVAGVREVIVCSPPGANGLPSEVVMAAAELAGADRLFAVGGAGAIAAMAYGTASIPCVDRIVGPGNAYVAEAKAQVASVTAIDSPAGPSELLVIADASASPEVVTRELLAQAEHDPMAAVALVSTSDALLDAVERLLSGWTSHEPRSAVISAALASRGALLLAASIDEAVAFANRWAPEHLLIATQDAEALLGSVRNAGTVFVGETASVAFGDYMSGANHVLPTGGLSRAYSGLSTIDFYRWTTWQRIDRATAARLAADVGAFADAEGLPAHAASARQWQEIAR
jgi:histidinol dehydrogenase